MDRIDILDKIENAVSDMIESEVRPLRDQVESFQRDLDQLQREHGQLSDRVYSLEGTADLLLRGT